VGNFRRVLEPGGRLVCWVPALPPLFGTLDQAVGHYRRYTDATIRAVLEQNGFEVEKVSWMNLAGIAGWWLNSVALKRPAIPSLQLRMYDTVHPLLARLERTFELPVGLSLLAVGRAR